MLTRLFASLAVVLASTFSEVHSAHATSRDEPPAPPPRLVAAPPDVAEVVLGFGDLLAELYDAVAYDEESRDSARIGRACNELVDAHPQLVEALDETGVELLVAAHSMVDACRQGVATTLPRDAFEIVYGDYYEYRELSLAFVR